MQAGRGVGLRRWAVVRQLSSEAETASANDETIRLVMDSNRQGMGFSQQGLHREAYDCFRHALRWCPHPHELSSLAPTPTAAARAGRGRPRKRDADEAAAVEDDDEELERKLHVFQWQTRRAAVLNNLGVTAQALGQLTEAEQLLKEAIELRLGCLGQVRALFGRETEPVVLAEQEQLALAVSVAQRHLAAVYAAMQQPQAAVDQLTAAVHIVRSKTGPRRAPFLAVALNNLATVRIKQNMLDEHTEQQLVEAVQLLLAAKKDAADAPDLPVVLKNLVHFYARSGQADKQADAQQQLEQLSEDNARFT